MISLFDIAGAAADATLPPAGGGGAKEGAKESAAPLVKSIVIASGWVGLGKIPEPGRVVITQAKEGYVAGGKPVPRALVDELVRAAREPAPRLTLEALDLANARRREMLPALLAGSELKSATEETRARFAAAWRDDAKVDEAVRSYYRSPRMWTDDYPRVAVEITDAGGRVTKLESGAQQPLMVPWTVTVGVARGGLTSQSWSGRFSRAVSALMPEGMPERTRLSGQYLGSELVRHVGWLLEREGKR